MEVEDALHSVIESSMNGPYSHAMGLAREILLAGGKRIRPILTLLAYDLVGERIVLMSLISPWRLN